MRFEAERTAVRMPYVAASRLRWNGRRECALVCNLSSGGVFLHVDEPPRGEAEVRFPLPDGGEKIVARAAVRWVDRATAEGGTPLPVACGLGFVSITDQDRERILRQVDHYLALPTPVLGIAQPRSGLMRVQLVAPCTLRGEFGTIQGKTCNLGVFGVYAAIDPQLPVGTEAELRLRLPEPIGEFVASVTVSWRNSRSEVHRHVLPPGCGLRFEGLARPEIRNLVRLVDDRLSRMPRIRG